MGRSRRVFGGLASLPGDRVFSHGFTGVGRLALVLLAVGLLTVPAAVAQTAHAGGTIAVGSGFSDPTAVAVDGSGDVFVADYGHSAVKEIVAVNGAVSSTSAVNVVGSGFSFPQGVAVDGSGDVFVADSGNSAVKEIVAVNGAVSSTSTVNVVGSGFFNPTGVAVDGSGDVFVADYGHSAVKEIVAVNGAVSSTSAVNVVGSGFITPQAVAVDGSGDVFVADTGNSAVKEIVAVNGLVSTTSTVNVVGSGFDGPTGVAVDGSGNVFVADQGHSAVKEIVAVNGAVSSTSTVNVVGSGFSYPQGVAVDGIGDVFVADTLNSAVKEILSGPRKFPATAVGSTSGAVSTVFTFDTGGQLNSIPYQVLTQGAQSLDFQAAATQESNACNATTAYSAGDICTVDVTFTPTRPWQRLGAVQLTGSGGTAIATAYLSGSGTGPLVAFPSNTAASAVGSGFSYPEGVAVDESGDVFVADYGHNAVKEIVAVNGAVSSTSTVKVVGSGFNIPYGVAVDGSGDVFVGDTGNSEVKEIVAVNGAVSPTSTVNVVGSGISNPRGVAVDGSGDVFVADADNNAVKEIVAVNGAVSSTSTVNVVGSGFNGPEGVAVDGSGDVFVADSNNSAVKEIVAVNGAVSSTSAVKVVGSAFSDPSGVAVDGSGDVFVADSGNNEVKEIVAVNGLVSSTSIVKVVGSGFSYPEGVAVDGSGDVFVADSFNSAVKEIDYAAAPSLSFPTSTDVGAEDTADSPQTATLENIGNESLTFPVPATGDNPSIATSFTLDSATTCPQLNPSSSTAGALAAGADCALAVDFIPQAGGSITGSLVLTDNNLNAAGPSYATQSIGLSGTGIAVNVNVTINTVPSGLSFMVNSTTYTAPQTLPLTIGTSYMFSAITPQDQGNTQYTFSSWSDGGIASHSITASSSVTSYTATFNPSAYLLTTAASPSGGGTVTPASGYYSAGNPVLLRATPAAGYVFAGWTGPVANPSSASTSVTMKAPESVTANFVSALTFSSSSMNFGTLYLGRAAVQSITLSNAGTTPLKISSIRITTPGSAPGDFGQITSCTPFLPVMPGTLAPGKRCTILVGFKAAEKIFSPTASTATLTVNDNAPGSPQTVSLTALVINPQASLSAPSLSFATQKTDTTSAPKTVTIKNTGNTPLQLGTLTVNGDFAIASGTTCQNGGTVAPSASCVVDVTFTPKARGLLAGFLTITDNALNSPQRVSLSGRGD